MPPYYALISEWPHSSLELAVPTACKLHAGLINVFFLWTSWVSEFERIWKLLAFRRRPLLRQWHTRHCGSSFVSVWTARICGIASVCSVIMMLKLIAVWPAEQANRLFGTVHCYESAGDGQISISNIPVLSDKMRISENVAVVTCIMWNTILTSVSFVESCWSNHNHFLVRRFLHCDHMDSLRVFCWLVH